MGRETSGKKAAGTTILECKACKDKPHWQDTEYGPGFRVHNNTPDGARCTVCGNERKR